MHFLRLLLFLLTFALVLPAAGWAAAKEAPRPATQAATGGPLDRAGREAWVREHLQRLDQANAVVLDPQAVARQRARFERVLQPFLEGQPDGDRAVERFAEELQVSQRAAVEHLTRQFRIEVYRTFRQNRGEYDRRRGEAAVLLDAWQDAGSPAAEQHKLVDWLLLALVRCRSGSIGPLPPIPAFDRNPPAAISMAPSEPSPPVAASPPTPGPVKPSVPTVPKPVVPPIPPTSPPVSAEPLPGPRPGEVRAGREGPPPTAALRQRSVLAAPAAVALPAAKPSPRAVPPARVIVETPPSEGPSRPAAGHPLPPAPEVSLPPPPPSAVSASAPPDAHNNASSTVPPAAGKVQINLQELAAQIAGNNLALEKLGAELDRQNAPSASELEPLVDRAAPLVVRHDDLKLVYDLLSPEEQRQVGRLNSANEVLSALGSRIAQARRRAIRPDYPGGVAARQTDLKRLEVASQKLSVLIFGGP